MRLCRRVVGPQLADQFIKKSIHPLVIPAMGLMNVSQRIYEIIDMTLINLTLIDLTLINLTLINPALTNLTINPSGCTST